jgi:hypothetical protein
MSAPKTDSAVTPGRATRIEWDYNLSQLSSRLWGGQRMFAAVAPGVASQKGADTRDSVRVHCWASGAWTIRPWQMSIALTQEKTPPVADFVLTPGDELETVPQTTLPLFRSPSGGGLATGGDVAADGTDPAWRKKRAADKNWDEAGTALTAPLVASLTSAITAGGATFTIPVKCIAKSNAALRANQGLCLRFSIPGTPHHAYDYIGGFLFGQYGVVLRGDGMAEIWEYASPAGGGTVRWAFLQTFRWTKPQRVCEISHMMIVYPHLGAHGEKFISFFGSEMDNSSAGSEGAGSSGQRGPLQSTEFLFRWDEATSTSEQAVSGNNVTTSAVFHLFERVDLRNFWQVSKLIFPKTVGEAPAATLTGEEWASSPGDTRSVSSHAFQQTPSGTTLTHAVNTSADASRVTFTFGGDGLDTPVLWGYRLYRNGSIATPALTGFTTKGKGFRLYAGGPDPRGDSASFVVDDLRDAYPRLRNRGELPFRIITSYKASAEATAVDVPLFAGYAIQPYRIKKGQSRRRQGRGNVGELAVYPSPEWSQYNITAAGMWHRLTKVSTRTALAFEFFAYDQGETPPTGSVVPVGWKVTEAIKYLLSMAGFPAGMVNIPDLAVRLRPGMSALAQQIAEPGASVAELIVKLCRSYLGRFLVFDPTQGTLGKWTLTGPPPPGDVTPLLNFVGAHPGSGVKAQMHLWGYPAGVCPTIGNPESFTIPPENNHIHCMTFTEQGAVGRRVDNHLYNYLSYDVPGASIAADPDSAHYLGSERVLIVADPTLWAGAGSGGGWGDTQSLIDFTMLRLFVTTCMARRVVKFRAPLALVTDPETSLLRVPRFYDPVTYRGQAGWFIVECRPEWNSDRIQLASYELQRLEPYLTT